ncbi:MAG: hypothetical protein LUQ31_10450 [Methanoregula sp.]|nr:hypothetical protein [Methanoregula sp.]
MTRPWFPLACECILCLIPLNIYVIGDYLATGVQWAFFRYQESPLGNSLIPLSRDATYVTGGVLVGSSAVSIILWIAGALLLLAALGLTILACAGKYPPLPDTKILIKTAGALTISTALLFLFAMFVQYGLMLHSEHGLSIPLGVPIILVTGAWLLHGNVTGKAPCTRNEAEPLK